MRFHAMGQGGWCGIEADEEHGGAKPWSKSSFRVRFAEMWPFGKISRLRCAICCPQGQIHALESYGTDQQKATYFAQVDRRFHGQAR